MGKTISYLDWELNFRKKPKTSETQKAKPKTVNSTGIQENILREYLKNWRKKNLP